MSCGPTKLSYLISFGIAPYFMDLVLKELKDGPCFVISFDESFNEELEKEQMDLLLGISRMVTLKIDTCHLDF